MGQNRSFNQFVGGRDNRIWHLQTKGLGGLQIDHSLKFRWPFDRQFRWRSPFKDPIYIVSQSAIRLGQLWSITTDGTASCEYWPTGNDRRTMFHSVVNDPLPILNGKAVGKKRDRLRWAGVHRGERGG